MPWVRVSASSRPMLGAVVTPDMVVTPMRLRMGFNAEDLRLCWAVIGGILIVPLLFVGALRLNAIRRAPDPAALRSFQTALGLVRSSTLLGWVLLQSRTGVRDLVLAPFADSSSAIRILVLSAELLSVPVIVMVVVSALTYGVEQRFRGEPISRQAYLVRSLLPLLLIMLPVIIMLVGMLAAPAGTTRLLFGADGRGGMLGSPILFALVVGAGTRIAARGKVMKMLKPEELDRGELLERLLALGRKAGVEISRVLVARTEQSQIANALVLSGGSIVLTDYLVRRFRRDEVDAVVSHELAHLRLKHLAKQGVAQLVALAIWLLVANYLQTRLHEDASRYIVYGSFWIIPPVIYLFVSRRHEMQADAEAVLLTAEPRVYIRMLARLSFLNRKPLRASPLLRLLSTHPDTRTRIDAVAVRAGIAPEEVESLILESRAPAEGEDPLLQPAAYAVPQEGEDQRVYTRENRMRAAKPLILWGLAPPFAVWILSLVVLINLAINHDHGKGLPWEIIAGPAGLVLGLALIMAADRVIGFIQMRRLRPLLETRVKDLYKTEPATLPYVGVSPGAEVRR